jgi:hypothetical protein
VWAHRSLHLHALHPLNGHRSAHRLHLLGFLPPAGSSAG